jgi:CHAT domain-containing protein
MEAPAAQITTDFFKEINRGKKADTALATAKRKYLDIAENPDCLPYFWAGFYLFGDANKLVSP